MMSIHILPSLLPDETIYGLAARIGRINGYQSDQETCEKLFGKSKLPRVADIAANFKNFSHATRNAYGEVDALARTTTSLSLFKGLGLYDDSNYKQMGTIEPLGLAALSNGYPHLWRWCNCCIEEDIDTYGAPYWHRNQQLPGVFICTRHKTPLTETAVLFRMRQQYFMHPNALPKTLESRKTLPSGIDADMAFNLACFVEHAAKSEFEITDSNVPLNVITDQLKTKELVTKSGKLRKPAFIKAFHNFLENFAYIEEVAALIANQNQSYLGGTLTSTAPSVALRRALLIYWLFGNWDLFLEYCSWGSVFKFKNELKDAEKIMPSKSQSADDHYKVCIDFIRQHPNAIKSDFWRARPKSCRWLIRNDKAWIEGIFNNPYRHNGGQVEMFGD